MSIHLDEMPVPFKICVGEEPLPEVLAAARWILVAECEELKRGSYTVYVDVFQKNPKKTWLEEGDPLDENASVFLLDENNTFSGDQPSFSVFAFNLEILEQFKKDAGIANPILENEIVRQYV